MAFIIPSKNIYDSNTPIIKNNFLNKIELTSQNVSIVEEHDTIGYSYNSLIGEQYLPRGTTEGVYDIDSQRTGLNLAYATISYSALTPIYCQFGSADNPIKIPKSNNNLRIINIPFSEGNLDYSIIGKISTHLLTKTPTISITNARTEDGKLQILNKDVISIISDGATEIGNIENEKTNQQIQLLSEYSSPTNELSVNDVYFFKSRATAKMSNNSSITLANEDDNYYYVHFYLLVGYEADYAEYKSQNGIPIDISSDIYTTSITMNGKRTQAYPSQVEVKFKGEVVRLKIEDKNIIVGDPSSPNSLAINANEFIQGATLNQSVSNNFKKVINEYQNGKRTIELLCDINEYFRLPNEYQELEYIDMNYAPVIDTGVSGGSNANYEIVFMPQMDSAYDFDQYFAGKLSSPIPKIYRDNFSLVLKVQNSAYRYNHNAGEKIYLNVMPNGMISINKVLTGALSSYAGSGWGDKTWLLGNAQDENNPSSMLLYSLKMRNGTETIRDFVPCYRKADNQVGLYDLVTKSFFGNQGGGTIVASDPLHYKNKVFEDGEEIIPMVYTARGNDEPIFKDQNGNAKKFKVVGNNVFFDGAVWQRIYGQEML
jgi:hypothetical protein